MKKYLRHSLTFSMLATCVMQTHAEWVYSKDGFSIKPTAELTYGMFYSDKSYNNPESETHKYWHEIYAKYGFKSTYDFSNASLYAHLIGISSATMGDGDAGGFTTGHEHKTSVDEWLIGYKNTASDKQDATLDISIGRQKVIIGDGFLVAGDALNLGKGIADELNRGGGYYLAARRSFDFTTVINYTPVAGLNTRWMYLESDNKAQYQPKLWATDWQYTFADNDIGLTYLQITDVDDPANETDRKNLKDIAVRGKTKINEQLGVAAEFVYQDKKHDNENAWYVGVNYTFDQLKYKPTLGYRFSSFSENYDSLFYGNTDAGFGTWFQGEVAGNYAGPFNSNARIHQVSLQASVKENLHLGLLAYKFDTIKKTYENLDGHEVDVFAVWSPTQNINVIPLIGFYKPKNDIYHLGTQVPNDKTNTYGQLILQYLY
ncbi:hypothetical protein [Acinetobacter stercoris]|uniref:Alginate export domain-containing protein n=1 Tax=Acinetobacter stercoris TaxID=2126983 RepID=A0A2U3MXL8_9GAMM|nr:hypothetical protein [Acinetobacter stercoris]SPL70182.1 hypothetical protein KPC_1360 [Acinetobacter stercoris]